MADPEIRHGADGSLVITYRERGAPMYAALRRNAVRGAAYDSKPRWAGGRDQGDPSGEQLLAQLTTFLTDRLSQQDMGMVQEMLTKLLENGATDQPEPFPGRPRPGGGKDPTAPDNRMAGDAGIRRRLADASLYRATSGMAGLEKRFPGIGRIRA